MRQDNKILSKMEKEYILNLFTKKLAGKASKEEFAELQNLLRKNLGIYNSHKFLLRLDSILSLGNHQDGCGQRVQKDNSMRKQYSTSPVFSQMVAA
jgi:hypothetical protein